MTPEQIAKARSFVASGYQVEPAVNGGFLLRATSHEPGLRSHNYACFTSAEDLLKYLRTAHEQDGPTFTVKW